MRIIVLLLLGLFPFALSAQSPQQRKLDSLMTIYRNHPQEDSMTIVNLRQVFRQYSNMKDWRNFRLYADTAIMIASKLPNKSSLSYVYFRIGGAYHNVDRLAAITNYNQAMEYGIISGNLKAQANPWLNLGALYMEIGDFPKSLEAHEKALGLFGQLGDIANMSSCFMNMSGIYITMGQKTKGAEYARKALTVFERESSNRGVGVASIALVELYLNATDSELVDMGVNPANKFREIQLTIDKGLKAVQQTDDHSLLSSFYRNLGRLKEIQGKYPEALGYYNQTLAEGGQDMDDENYSSNFIAVGKFYIDRLNDFPKGNGMLHMALASARKIKAATSVEESLEALSGVHEKRGSYDSALFYYRQLILVKNETYNKEKEQEITRRQLKIDFEMKEREYRNAQQLSDARLKQQEQEILLRKQQLQIIDKQKTLEHLEFLQKQAVMENRQKAQEQLLAREQLQNDYETKFKDQRIGVQRLELVSNRRLSVFLAVLAIIVFAGALFVYESRKKTVKLNKQVSEQKAALEELVKVKDRIFSVVSHDMRGPVNNMFALSTILEEADISKEQLAVYLQQIRGTLDHTASLVENLLNWSASQMSGFTPVIEPIDLSTALQHALKGVAKQMLDKELTIYDTVAPGICVNGDRHMTELIIRNLITNAVKFSQKGGKLELFAHTNNGEVVLSIKDNGVGMDARKVEMINSATVGALESTMGTAREKGTGLGLMLSKHFARMMGGNISVASDPGVGTSFYVSLPAAA